MISGADLEHGVSEVGPRSKVRNPGVERAVARGKVNVAFVVCGWCHTPLPDGPLVTIRGGVEDRDLLEGLGIVADQPAMVGTLVAVRRPADIDHPVEQEQARPLVLALGEEPYDVSAQ